jgi:hypothetical protein
VRTAGGISGRRWEHNRERLDGARNLALGNAFGIATQPFGLAEVPSTDLHIQQLNHGLMVEVIDVLCADLTLEVVQAPSS